MMTAPPVLGAAPTADGIDFDASANTTYGIEWPVYPVSTQSETSQQDIVKRRSAEHLDMASVRQLDLDLGAQLLEQGREEPIDILTPLLLCRSRRCGHR
jgi:hypothetical protein